MPTLGGRDRISTHSTRDFVKEYFFVSFMNSVSVVIFSDNYFIKFWLETSHLVITDLTDQNINIKNA